MKFMYQMMCPFSDVDSAISYQAFILCMVELSFFFIPLDFFPATIKMCVLVLFHVLWFIRLKVYGLSRSFFLPLLSSK